MKKLIATGKPVVLILFGGRAQIISDIADKCAAIIQAWYPGEEGGNALADILYGNVNPSGKLSVSYPAVELHEPICYNYGMENDKRIAYPFGYGLSYTTFEYSNLSMDTIFKTTDKGIRFCLDVTNTGKYKGDEIVQIYISPADNSSKLKPIQLQGFKRVSLKPGESRKVEFYLNTTQFGFYDNGHWSVKSGKYLLKIGASSTDIRLQKEVAFTGEQRTTPLREKYFAE